jgi:hypothetical protein
MRIPCDNCKSIKKTRVKRLFFFGIALLFLACNDDNGEEKLLGGTIGGQEWIYQYASTKNATSLLAETSLFGTEHQEVDPCDILFSDKGYIIISAELTKGMYQIPSEIQVVFEQPGTDQKSFSATDGLMDIISINGRRVYAYLEAKYDEQNDVDGSVIFDTCY